MDYKETVMTRKELNAINDTMPSTAKYGEVFEAIADKQAEISYKAGLRQVIAWVNDNIEMTARRYTDWEAQLREWGIK